MNHILRWSVLPLILITLFSSCERMDTGTTHTVTFISNGGTNIAPTRVIHGTPLPKDRVFPDPIVSDGGSFVGWYSDSDLLIPYDFSQPVVTDIQLYAKWFYKTFTITFVMNGAPAISPKEVREGHLPELETPSYDDHLFVNWYLDEAFTELFNQNDPITKDITVYARWTQASPAEWFVIDNGVLVQCNPPDNTEVVIIPEGVTTIPDWFVLANGLNEPGKPGFPTGKNIKEFILPQSLETIGRGAFKYAAITQIQIPAGVRQLEPVTFDGCDQLVSFTFAEGSQLERLAGNDGNEAVITASQLKEISFPPSLQYVGKYTLAGCQALLTVTFERSESPVIFDSYLPGGGVWLFGGYFPNKIRVPEVVRNAFISEMRKVMQDYEFNNMSSIVEGY